MGIFRNPAVIIAIILLVVLLFGSRRLPDVARSVGASLKIFKKEVKELHDGDDEKPSGTTSERTTAEHRTTDEASATPAPGATDPKNA